MQWARRADVLACRTEWTPVLGRDGDALAEAVLSVSRTTRAVDRSDFGAQLTALLHPVAGVSLEDVRLGDVLVAYSTFYAVQVSCSLLTWPS